MTSEQRIEELQELVEEQEVALHDAVEELEHVARRAIDVRRWIQTRPLAWIGGAFLVGAWLGGRSS